MKNQYNLTIGGLIHVNEEEKILEKIELFVDDEWVPLITDVSATKYQNLKIIVDGYEPSQMVRLSFPNFGELERIKAIRITGFVVREGKYNILHVARNTVETRFAKGEDKEYAAIINLQFFTLLLQGESQTEMMKRTISDYTKYNTTLFLDCTHEDAELDEYKLTEHKQKTLVPRDKAVHILYKQFPEAEAIIEKFQIERWNYTERQGTHEIEPVSQTEEKNLKRVRLI